MKFVDNAGRIARRAWSMRMIYVSVVLGAIDVAMPMFAPEQPSRAFGVASVLVGILAAVFRLVAQPGLHRDP